MFFTLYYNLSLCVSEIDLTENPLLMFIQVEKGSYWKKYVNREHCIVYFQENGICKNPILCKITTQIERIRNYQINKEGFSFRNGTRPELKST